MSEKLGIYIHVPFCAKGKCPYCDFYSLLANDESIEKYINAVEKDLQAQALMVKKRKMDVDTVYFGGGTPSLLGVGLARILGSVRENYSLTANAEITFEANPADVSCSLLCMLRKAGFNRISLGMQSAIQQELVMLGRRHSAQNVAETVRDAKLAGFGNISLDLMLCVPGQTRESMISSIEFAASLSPEHISAYLLKIENGTHFYDIKDTLCLPNDDEQADMYLAACDELESRGFAQYEISNFAVAGFESRHNMRYWNCSEYLGFGPAAHSFFDGKRFYYNPNLENYIAGERSVSDGDGGSLEEYIMLRLRLREGLLEAEMLQRFGVDFSSFDVKKIAAFEHEGLLKVNRRQIYLTKKGYLLSNSVISELIFQQRY